MLTTFNEVDMSSVMMIRNREKDNFLKKHGVKLGFMSFFVKAAITALKEWPAVLPETKLAKRFLEEVLEGFQNEKPANRMEIQHQIAARAACRSAVMANDAMAAREVAQLLEDLSACEHPMTCPHGRPTHVRLTLAELHRRFRRT